MHSLRLACTQSGLLACTGMVGRDVHGPGLSRMVSRTLQDRGDQSGVYPVSPAVGWNVAGYCPPPRAAHTHDGYGRNNDCRKCCGLDLRLALSGCRFGARSTTKEGNAWPWMSTCVTLQENVHHII